MRIKNSGLTLLELLLVIVLLSLLATMSIALYKSKSADTKVTKAALQMQQILQSAMAYYSDNQCWPNAANCPAGAPSFDHYLPINSLKIPWGEDYKFIVYGQKFRVVMNFPAQSALPFRKQLAAELVAILPAAQVDDLNDPHYLMAEIARPARQNQSNLMIAAIGTTNVPITSGTQVAFNFNCPAQWTGMGAAAVNTYSLEKMTCPFTSRAVGTLTAPVNCTVSAGNNYICSIALTHSSLIRELGGTTCFKKTSSSEGSFGFFYIGYCVNPNAPAQQLKLF